MARGLPKSIIKKYGISKKAWSVYRGSKRKTKKRSNPTKMARRRRTVTRYVKRGSSRRSFTLPIALIGGVIGMPAVQRMAGNLMSGNFDAAMRNASQIIGVDNGQFNAQRLKENMLPLFIGWGVHWLAGKLGVNRMLGRARVPILRI